jgi:hypothetical protein
LIKNLQQRLNDMRKTLQKELKYQSLPNDRIDDSSNHHSLNNGNNTFTTNNNRIQHGTLPSDLNNQINSSLLKRDNSSLPKTPTTPTNTNNTISMSSLIKNNNESNSLTFNNSPSSKIAQSKNFTSEDVNFKYLKHVVLKCLTSREYEVKSIMNQ